MSNEPKLEFSIKCIGFVPRDDFPFLCAAYNLDGTCNFFLPKNYPNNHEGEKFICDDLIRKEGSRNDNCQLRRKST